MKVAAAVLGASLLFFVGVLTGVGRREAVPPPAAIPLGVASQGSTGGGSPTTRAPSPPRTPRTTARPGDPAGSSATTASTVTTVTTAPTAPGETTTTTQPSATTTVEPTTSTTARVEQVDGQVDCAPAGRQGTDRPEPCPSTTTTGAGSGGGGNP